MKLPLALLPLTLLAACQVDAGKQMAAAREAFAAHRFGEVRSALAPVLAQEPGNAEARVLLARATLATGHGEAARAALAAIPPAHRPADHALLLGEANLLSNRTDDALAAVAGLASAEADRIRALAWLGKDDPAKAVAAFEAGLRQTPPVARLAADYARYKLQTRDTPGARALAAAALKADPASLDGLLVTAQIAIVDGDLQRADRTFAQVLQRYPGNLAAVAGRAGVLGDLGRTREMQALLAGVQGQGANNGPLAFVQARAAAAKGDWTSARAILQGSRAALEGNDPATVLLAEALQRLGQPEQARTLLVPVLTRSPANLSARRELARIQLAQRDGAGAMATLQPLVGLATADPLDARAYAQAAALAGKPEATRIAEDARYPTPQWLAANLALADTALRQSHWGQAVAIYNRVLAVTDGRNPLVLNNLAVAQSKLGNKREALGHALKALQFAPANASVMDTAGQLLVETGGDRRKALELLRDASRRDPGNAAIREHLAHAEAAA